MFSIKTLISFINFLVVLFNQNFNYGSRYPVKREQKTPRVNSLRSCSVTGNNNFISYSLICLIILFFISPVTYSFAGNQTEPDSPILDGDPDVIFTGSSSNHYLGRSVAPAGDVNNDGYPDIIIGSPGYNSNQGRAYIYFGGATFDNVADVTLTGLTTNNLFGICVASAGDVNNDGYDDVVVGAQMYNSNQGRAYIYYGGASMNNTADVTMTGEGANQTFGRSVASAGDVNNDGFSDVIICADGYNIGNGRVYIYFGSTFMNNTADIILNNYTPDFFGYSVAGAGDVNNDGYSDVIVGAYQNNSATGKAYIFLGGTSMDTVADVTLTGTIFSYFGRCVASAGDVNGDGYSDVIVGADQYGGGTGRTYIFHGGASMNNTPDVTLVGTSSSTFGISVSTAGDLNYDGYSDVIVGAWTYSSQTGRAYIYYGGSPMDSIAELTLTGEGTANYFGSSVSAAGDVSNEAIRSVIVGAYGYGSGTGRAYIYKILEPVGVSGALSGNGQYSNLKDAFTSINNSDQTGSNIIININNNTVEPSGGAVLNQGTWNSLTIKPYGNQPRTISGAINPGTPMIDLNGADRVTIDGLNSGGNSLTITNTSTSSIPGTSTIRIQSDAINNNITNCTILGSSSTFVNSEGGNIVFGGNSSTTGNDNNTISFCDIGPAGGNLPSKGIYSSGTTSSLVLNNSNDTIKNCNVYDFFSTVLHSAGVYLNTGSSAFTFSNNKFYQTSLRTMGFAVFHFPMWIDNGDNHSITGNTIGYSSSSGTGTYAFSGPSGSRFIPLFLAVGNSGTTNVQGNIISNISVSGFLNGTGSSTPFACIFVNSGITNISGNTIGSMTEAASINYTTVVGFVSNIYGIANFGTSAWTTNNNKVSGITTSNTNGSSSNIYCLSSTSPGIWTCQNNTIGGSNANSLTNTCTASDAFVNGITNLSSGCLITNNLIQNMTCSGGSGSSASGSVIGIVSTSTSDQTISGNKIHTLTNLNSTSATVVTGIYYTSGSGTNLIEKNLIYGLSINSNTAITNGFNIQGGKTTIKNNMISLGTTSSGAGVNKGCLMRGIVESAGCTNNFYFNSIYVGGNPSEGTTNTYCLLTAAQNNPRNYKNNIFHNARSNNGSTGKHYSLTLPGTTVDPIGLDCNNNDLFANGTGGVLGFYNGADRPDLTSWKLATGQDSSSISSDPKFISSSNLHIDTTVYSPVNSAGIPIAGVTDDFDGNIRNVTTPDLGADEFNGPGAAISLNLTIFIEGFYNSSSNIQVSDSVRAYLRSSSTPYAIVDSAKAVISPAGNSSLTFSNAVTGNYYLMIKHRNSIETWSSSAVSFTQGSATNYNFTSASSQAYGNNMKQIDAAPLSFGVFSGDVNQDGLINLNDIISVSNASSSFSNGYVVTDVNGDNITNLNDILITYNNSAAFISKATP